MMHMPIYGSQINPPAKLFKKYTASSNAPQDANILKYGSNFYKCYYKFPYVEVNQKTIKLMPNKGIVAEDVDLIIKFNGRFIAKPSEIDEPEVADIITIRNETWLIDSIQRKRLASCFDVGVVYLALKKIIV